MTFARAANRILEQYAAEDFRAYFIVWENSSFQAPNAAYCGQVRTQFGLTFPTVLYDQGQLETIGLDDRHFHFVMRRGGKVEYRRQFVDNGFEAVIQQLLAE